MNQAAFVFTSAPHGTTSGREGLDALLATSALIKDVGVFFVSDGVFQLLSGQQPWVVLARDYISTFKVLPFYDVVKFWVCAASLRERGLNKDTQKMVLDMKVVDHNVLCKELNSYKTVLTF